MFTNVHMIKKMLDTLTSSGILQRTSFYHTVYRRVSLATEEGRRVGTRTQVFASTIWTAADGGETFTQARAAALTGIRKGRAWP